MPRQLLTIPFVQTVTVQRRTNFFDSKVQGLVLRVTPSGAKTWYFVYRFKGAEPRWLHLGTTETLSLGEARARAITHRHTIEVEHTDPGAEPEAAPVTAPPFTFRDFVPVYLAFAKGTKDTWHEDRRKIERHLLPIWGDMPLRAITRTHIHELLDRLVGQGMTLGVNRVQAVISRMFTVALDRSLVDAHPCVRMIKRFDETKFGRDRVLSDDEIRTMWNLLETLPERSADAVRLRLLTGQRITKQIMRMEWPEVDFERGIWTIPRQRMKKRRPHVIPLSTTVRAILERRYKTVPEDEPRVFPGLYPGSKEYRKVLALGQKFPGFDWLDLRRTMTTRLAEMKVPKEIRRAILSHGKGTGDTEGVHYNMYEFLDEKRAALEAWDAEVRRIIEGRPREQPKVLRHRPKSR